MFSKPVLVEGVPVVGYFDEVIDIPDGMSAISWGYLVGSTVAKTVSAFKKHIWQVERLRSDDIVFVRSEVFSHDKPSLGWAPVKTEPGVPQRKTIERVLLVEPYDGETSFIRFGCSVQGNITEPILKEIRPDLRP
jgi:hypothetical protein